MISYWTSFPGTDDVVLCAQLSDWRRFRVFQRRIRRYYQNKPFSSFVDTARQRRQRHGLDGESHLRFDLEQQSRLESWIEFQNYHLQRFEQLGRKRDERVKELENFRERSEDTGSTNAQRAAQDTESIRRGLEYAERNLEWHMVLLKWIEQERREMDTENSTMVKDNDDEDVASRTLDSTSIHNCHQKRPEAFAVLGNIRVSKAKSKNRNMRIDKSKAPEIGCAIKDSKPISQNSISQALKCREAKPQHVKENPPFRQLHSQRVSQEKRFINVENRPIPQGPQPTHEYVVTRSGRISKPPGWIANWKPNVAFWTLLHFKASKLGVLCSKPSFTNPIRNRELISHSKYI